MTEFTLASLANNSSFEKGSVPPPKSGAKDPRARASKALANAKQRCTNKNNPDYPNYGGSGILCLIVGVDHLISHIGLPKPGQSLDRIDPQGHYEVGNVRWANAAVQAANKKASVGNSHLAIASQIKAAREALALHDNRKNATVGWIRTTRAFNVGHMPSEHADWMAESLHCAGVIESNFDFDTVYDYANASPGFIHLPALSLPNARVRLRCWPSKYLPTSDIVQKMGRLGGLEDLSPDFNMPSEFWTRVRTFVHGQGAGLVLHGQPTAADLLGGWVEGTCLALASAVATQFSQSVACYPMLRVLQMLGELGSPFAWDEISHALLDARLLLIPDFSLDCGAWGVIKTAPWWKIEALLRHRYEEGLQTILGIQNLAKMPPAAKEIVLGAYNFVAMPHLAPHSRENMQFASTNFGVPESATTLRAIRLDQKLSRLVTP